MLLSPSTGCWRRSSLEPRIPIHFQAPPHAYELYLRLILSTRKLKDPAHAAGCSSGHSARRDGSHVCCLKWSCEGAMSPLGASEGAQLDTWQSTAAQPSGAPAQHQSTFEGQEWALDSLMSEVGQAKLLPSAV